MTEAKDEDVVTTHSLPRDSSEKERGLNRTATRMLVEAAVDMVGDWVGGGVGGGGGGGGGKGEKRNYEGAGK